MSFEQLMGRLNQVADLAKALPADADGVADDKKIAAAAEEGSADGKPQAADGSVGNQGADGADNAAGADDGNPEDEEDEGKDGAQGEGEGEGADAGEAGKPMAKSFTLTLEDGSEMEAFDATELLKSLQSEVGELTAKGVQTEEQILKSLNVAADLIAGQAEALKQANSTITAQAKQLDEQGALIKSLAERVDALANGGRGRASTVSLAAKPDASGEPMNKAMGEPLKPVEILAKAQSALKAGRISGAEAVGIETRVNMGVPVDAHLIAKIS
jgi:hypothetical protein